MTFCLAFNVTLSPTSVSTVLVKTCVSISSETATPPAEIPDEILFNSVFDLANIRTSCASEAVDKSSLTVVLDPILARVVELATVVATTPATPTAPNPKPTGAKFTSSFVSAAIERPRLVSLSKLASTTVKLSVCSLPSWSRVAFEVIEVVVLSILPLATAIPLPWAFAVISASSPMVASVSDLKI